MKILLLQVKRCPSPIAASLPRHYEVGGCHRYLNILANTLQKIGKADTHLFCFNLILTIMLPKSKNKSGKVVKTSMPKKRGKASKEQPPPIQSDTETTKDADEEPTMTSMLTLLTALDNRME